MIALPATMGLMLLAQPILATLFQYGEFAESDTLMAGMSLMAYSLGLPAFILIKILANAFYARQDSKTPVRIGIIAMLVNMVLVILMWNAALFPYGVAGMFDGLDGSGEVRISIAILVPVVVMHASVVTWAFLGA